MINMKQVLAPLIVSGMALATGGWFLQRGVSQEQNVYVQEKLFQEVVNHVANRFVDKKEQGELYKMAIDGMLEELGDPHTVFMTSKDYNALRVQTQGEYGGLGIQIDKRNGWITVITPLPGTPAERAGIQAGDQIVEFNGKTTKDWNNDQAVQTLRGPKGTTVEIKIARPGMEQPIPFKLTREEIHVKSVPAAYMVEPGVGYVELTVFSESSTDELRAAITNLRKQGAKSLILDLRSNPGGLLDQGVSVSDLFLEKGQVVVETKSRVPGQNQKATAIDPDEFPGMPITVLVGPGSASAAEIVAGALQDHDRALVVGRTSYGKGSVQQVFQLSNENFLKMTTARWFTPVGRSIQAPYGIGADGAFAEGDEPPPPPPPPPPPEGQPGQSPANDSTKKPAYKTDSGRTVYGGGGIHPDIVVVDSLTTAERALAMELNKNPEKVLDTRIRFAVRYTREHPTLQPNYTVDAAVLNAFYRELQDAGINIDRAIYDRAGDYLQTWLGYQISMSKWGTQEARRRLNMASPEIRVAAELLRKSSTPRALFAQADAYNKLHAQPPAKSQQPR